MSDMNDDVAVRSNSSAPAARCQYSIVVPCFNEQECIEALIEEIADVAAHVEACELIVVDDCSTDNTRERLLAARHQHAPLVRVGAHPSNAGQSAAVCTGVELARGEWIVTLDGDGQNDPKDIPKLIAAASEHFDPHRIPIICGHRTQRQDSAVKKMSSRIANGVRGWLLKDDTPDTGCGLKCFHRETFMRFPRFNHMHRFLPALTLRAGGQVISVPVSHRPRTTGVSKYGIHNRLWVGIVDLFGVIWLRRRQFKSTDYEELGT